MIGKFFNCENTGRMSGDERRDQILRTAVELFSQHGFKGTTTKEIARASGVSEATVFKHFATKDELYGAILHAKACIADEYQFPWEGNPDVLKALEEKDDFSVFYNIALAVMNKHQKDVAFMRLLIYSALEEHDLAERFFNEFIEKVYEYLGGYIARRQSDGAFRNIKPKMVVRAFVGMLIHHSLNNILWDKNRVILNISNEEAAKNFAEVLLVGIKAGETGRGHA